MNLEYLDGLGFPEDLECLEILLILVFPEHQLSPECLGRPVFPAILVALFDHQILLALQIREFLGYP
jgi:hypothetical protein